ncbi:MAG: hypothetical protein IJ763_06220 [Lachnospiraceae bacterium]|nr:hypothetical protein [Lachnospiraceae bacterium]
MSYKSTNEIEKFTFDDCVLSSFKVNDAGIILELEALIVDSNNSQNTNYTESYADTTTVRFLDGKIISAKKDGYKYYDANEVLMKEVPDVVLSDEETDNIIKTCVGAYLYYMEKDADNESSENIYNIGLEFTDEEDNTAADSYEIKVSFSDAIFTWERFLNRVQR